MDHSRKLELTYRSFVLLLVAGCTIVPNDGADATQNDTPGDGDSHSQTDPGSSTDDDVALGERRSALTALVNEAGRFEPPAAEGEFDIPGAEVSQQEGKYYCTYRTVSAIDNPSELVALQSLSTNLWPGNVVRGDEAQRGVLAPVTADLGPVTFSVSLLDGARSGASVVGQMDQGRLSSFRQELNRLLSQPLSGGTSRASSLKISRITSSEQVAKELGVEANWPGLVELEGKLGLRETTEATRLLVDYWQAYFTVDVDAPLEPTAVFGPSVSVAELRQSVTPDSPPVYVQSVTYGRRIVGVFSTSNSASADELEGRIESFLPIGGEVRAESSQQLAGEEFVATAIGESATATNVDELMALIRSGASYSADSPGAPIAYKLAYLADNRPAVFSLVNEYTVPSCRKNRADLRVGLQIVNQTPDGAGEDEIYGQVWIDVPTEASNGSCAQSDGAERIMLLDIPSAASELYYTGAEHLSLVDVPIGDDSYFCVGGHLYEADAFVNDDFGPIRQDQIALDDRVADGISQEFAAQLGSNSSTVTIVVTEE